MAWKNKCWKITMNSFEQNETSEPLLILEILDTNWTKGDEVEYDLYLTSEKNFYGLGRHVWHDGKVAKHTITSLERGVQKWIRITKVVQTNFIRKCSHKSYFENLGEEFLQSDLTEHVSKLWYKVNRTKQKCDSTELCLPFSLPVDFQLCNNTTPEQYSIQQSCYFKALLKVESDIKRSIDSRKIYPKSCTLTEYTSEIGWSKEIMRVNKPMGQHISNTTNHLQLIIWFRAPRWTNMGWSDKAKKIVKQEYYVMDTVAFVGQIGGTLGLFVGLSVVQLNRDFCQFLLKLLTRMKPSKPFRRRSF